MATEPAPLTLSEVVHRAANVCDPAGEDDGVTQFLTRFEDRDEPISAVADIEQELTEAAGALDPEQEDPMVTMTAAVATYLAFRRDEAGDDRDRLLRLAARAEFHDAPPEPVARWLEEQGVAG